MPGIVGIISYSPSSDSMLLDSMLSSIDHFSYIKEIYRYDHIDIGRISKGYLSYTDKISITRDGRYMAVLSGEIFNYKSIEASEIINDQDFFLQTFVQDGFECLKYLNGHFTAGICDFKEETFYLISDRMGTHPHYYASFNNQLLFAPEVKAILKSGIDRGLNYSAISDLFSFAHLFGHKTLFKNIHQLPEASYLKYDKKGITIHKYWELPEIGEAYDRHKVNKKDEINYIEQFKEIFSRAMERNFTKNQDSILLSLSGGLDSRYVAAYAKNLGISPLISFTMGPDNSEDILYSRRVAEYLGIEHNQFEVKPENIWHDAKRFSEFADYMSMIYGPIQGFEALEHYYGKKQITVSSQMCDALFGGNLWRRKLKILLAKKKFDPEAENIVTDSFKLFPEPLIESIFAGDFYKLIQGQYKEVPEQYIKSAERPIHAYINLLMNEHGRRGTFSGNLMNNLFMETRMPSYDNEVIEFAYKLPVALREHQYLYRKVFSILFPELAKIKRERYRIPVSASQTMYKLSILETKIITVLKRNKLKAILSMIPRYNRPTYIDYNKWFKVDLNSEMKSVILDKKTLSRGIFKEEGIRKLISMHDDSNNDYSRLLWQIINLEYFFRSFID